MKFCNIVLVGIIVCVAAGAQNAFGKVVLKALAEGAVVPQLWPEQKEFFETPLEKRMSGNDCDIVAEVDGVLIGQMSEGRHELTVRFHHLNYGWNR